MDFGDYENGTNVSFQVPLFKVGCFLLQDTKAFGA